jgi:RNA polymerase sigma factor (sigma-70 family)
MGIENNSFEDLLSKCRNAVERFIYYKLPTKEDAQDVLQEVLITAYKKFDTLQDKSKFKSWMLSIASNKCNDYFRKRMKAAEIPLEDVYAYEMTISKSGLTVTEIVNQTLVELDSNSRKILYLFYIKGISQKDIASKLNIPIGTVKSRLNTARRNFKEKYPYPPNVKGADIMSKKLFPDILPSIKIVKHDSLIFSVLFEELPGWFVIPRLGQKTSWAIYDYPQRTLTEVETCEVAGKAQIHGVDCVEIKCAERTLYARLTDTHVQYVADIHYHGDVKVMTSFLDDDWLKNWSYGEDNCGREIKITAENPDIIGVYEVTVGSKAYTTLKLIDTNTDGIYTESYIDKNGRTVLWRRFNRNDWNVNKNGYYKIPWTEKFPDNERISIGDDIYVHWYDCISDYIL